MFFSSLFLPALAKVVQRNRTKSIYMCVYIHTHTLYIHTIYTHTIYTHTYTYISSIGLLYKWLYIVYHVHNKSLYIIYDIIDDNI